MFEVEPASDAGAPSLLAALASAAGLRRIDVLAWRDLDDPEAGGSELHAHQVLSQWAAAGIDVTLRTSAVRGQPAEVERDGYRVVRRSGRYAVFPVAAAEHLAARRGGGAGVVEIWNGMPFLSPVWARRVPRVVLLHHVHAEMWRMVLPPALAATGSLFEARVAPLAYRRTPVVTLSESSRAEIVSMLGVPGPNVTVVPPGIDGRFTPGGSRCRHPLVVAVGRLVPVKNFAALVAAVAELRPAHPGLEAVIVGEGYERPALEEAVRRHGAERFVSLPGRLGADELVELYRSAWVLASSSVREGWGMTVTEAAACGTPAVASRIAGHLDAVEDGVTGLLYDDRPGGGLAAQLDRLLSDDVFRHRLGRAALERSAPLTWAATALGILNVLAAGAGAGVRRRRGASVRRGV